MPLVRETVAFAPARAAPSRYPSALRGLPLIRIRRAHGSQPE
jgi:hypothetical protein